MENLTNNFLFRTIIISLLLVSLFTLVSFKLDHERRNDEDAVRNSKLLDANNISTVFTNVGMFNYAPFDSNFSGFEWPKGSGKFARFASGIWIGARVGNDTLIAVAEYSFEYLPGYTDNNGVPQGKDDPLYKIYKLFLGVNDPDRMNWPNALLGNSDQGAPVYFDSQTNTWKPLDFGHQTLFYRMTDSYPESHTLFNTAPLKADLMRIDFAIDLPSLADVAFSQFTIINRSNTTWNNAYLTVWTDDDLGNAADDRVGCDSARQLGYTWNGSPTDAVYGIPPAVGFLVLRGAIVFTGNNTDTVYICRNKIRTALVGYKDLKMSVFNWYVNNGGPINGDPVTCAEAYRYMSGFRRNGSPIINPIGGYQTKHMFTGDPVTNTGWVQTTNDDQRFMVSSGPVNMAPNDTQVIVVAQVIAQGSSNLNSITLLRNLTTTVKNYYNTCYTSPPIGIEPISSEVPTEFKFYQNYPNPFNPVTRIKFDIAASPLNKRGAGGFVSLKLFDAPGREVATLVNEELEPGTYNIQWDATNFPSGVYFCTLNSGTFSESKRIVLLK